MGAFGERLKREREQRKISLDEVAMATKIGTRMLRAIEQERFELLPGGVFNKGFVRAYARHLGLDEEICVAEYLDAMRARQPVEPASLDPTVVEGPELPARRFEFVSWGKVSFALLVLAFGVALWGTLSRGTRTASSVPSKEIESAQPETPAKPAMKKTSPRQTRNAVETSQPEAAKPQSEKPADGEKESVEPVAGAAIPAMTQQSGGFLVRIQAREDSWLHITADGEQIMEDILAAEGNKSIAARKELVIKAGNIGGLDFWFNGTKLPAQGGLDEVKTVTFGQTGLVTSAARVQPPTLQ